jgi:hypothetical protein
LTASVQKGTVVRVLGPKSLHHNFKEGLIVTATGEDFGPHHLGVWSNFKDEEGDTQFLLPHHYELVDTPKVAAPVVVVKEEAVKVEVAEVLPNKAVYGVLNAEDEIYATTADRDFARELKAALGGKRKGVRIFQYTAVKEIR